MDKYTNRAFDKRRACIKLGTFGQNTPEYALIEKVHTYLLTYTLTYGQASGSPELPFRCLDRLIIAKLLNLKIPQAIQCLFCSQCRPELLPKLLLQ